jgi:hypothetical protein
MGVYLDTISQLCYSCSEDKKVKVLDINKNLIIADIPVGNEKHTAMIGDKDNKRIFVSNRAGQVFIYDISTVFLFSHIKIRRKNQRSSTQSRPIALKAHQSEVSSSTISRITSSPQIMMMVLLRSTISRSLEKKNMQPILRPARASPRSELQSGRLTDMKFTPETKTEL